MATVVNFFRMERDGKIRALFDVDFGGVTVKECRLVEGSKGLFVAPPYRQYTDRGGNKQYKNLAIISEALAADILKQAKAFYDGDDEGEGWS